MRAVKCETQEEWDFVNEKLKSKDLDLPSSYWGGGWREVWQEGRRGPLIYKNLDSKTYGCLLDYNFVFTFENWCKQEGHEYLEDLNDDKETNEDLNYLEVLFKKLNIN